LFPYVFVIKYVSKELFPYVFVIKYVSEELFPYGFVDTVETVKRVVPGDKI
jgi:hypothetical protein